MYNSSGKIGALVKLKKLNAESETVYEFDIVNSNGVETKVEVDTTTGKNIEVAIEKWETDEEANEIK